MPVADQLRLLRRCSLFIAIFCASRAGHAQLLPGGGINELLKDRNTLTLAKNTGSSPLEAAAVKNSKVTVGAEGPWGQLEYYPVYLEAADSMIEKFPLPNSRTRWAFPIAMKPSLAEFFKSAGIDRSFIDAMMNPTSLAETDTSIYVFPPQAMLETMPPGQRGTVYAELRKYPENEFHAEPVLITTGNIDDWFRSSDLKPNILALIKQMSYQRGDTIAFSDLADLMAHAGGEAEARDILKACTRSRGYVVSLRMSPQINVQSMIDYWTTGLNLRRKDIEPLLNSIKDTEGVASVDLMHILPPLPRKLLLSYPDNAMSRDGIMPDCHWTSLNFFNYDPQPYLLDSRLATTAVLERFTTVPEPYRYGDILFFLDIKNGDAFHSCVYLADGLVFSKNGRNVLSPWVITTLDELKKIYLFDGNGRVQAYRNKQSPFLNK